jgi:diacylglycerol O-acyltransferase
MIYTHFERLSALDATFLEVEDRNAHMHVGAVALFPAAPLTGSSGLIDMERIRRVVQASLHRVPRYQQRLVKVPIFGNPVWVDDERFNIHYHVRHVRLPTPGDERLLKRLAGRIMSQQLDRGKPLWELWVIEGVEGNRVALVTKAHHCMIDGVGSVELTGALIRATAEIERRVDAPPRWIPRPAPAPWELLTAEISRRMRTPVAFVEAARRVAATPGTVAETVRDAVLGIGEALSTGLTPASPTPLNTEIGPHRRFDWFEVSLDVAKDIKARLGGTLNDVVLAVVSGALGRFLHGRGLRVEDLDFRAMIPVNVRTEAERETMGNRVTMLVARLPLGERDPRRRLQAVSALAREAKGSRQALGVRTLEEISDWTLTTLFSAFARLSASARPYNVVVTNVPGPQFPTYFLGAPTQAVYPLVPLNRGQALGIALFSYNGKLFWGFNADWDVVPDLHDLVEATKKEFELLQTAATLGPLADRARATAPKRRSRPRRSRQVRVPMLRSA